MLALCQAVTGDSPGAPTTRRLSVLPGDLYTRQMLEQHHRASLVSHLPTEPAWERREAASYSIPARRPSRRLRLLIRRFRVAHGGL